MFSVIRLTDTPIQNYAVFENVILTAEMLLKH